MPLQIRRGTEAERQVLASPPQMGEMIWITDDQKLYIGDGATLLKDLTNVSIAEVIDSGFEQLRSIAWIPRSEIASIASFKFSPERKTKESLSDIEKHVQIGISNSLAAVIAALASVIEDIVSHKNKSTYFSCAPTIIL